MTDAEERALNLFIRIVAEFNSAQEIIDLELREGNKFRAAIAGQMNIWTASLRCDESQEALNELALELVTSLKE